MFNFQKLLEDYNIPIPQGTRNTGIGWINIQCPFDCGDTANHLGFNTEKNYFHCWKCNNDNHSGFHSIKDVIEKLLPFENSTKIIEKYTNSYDYTQKFRVKLNKNTQIDKILLPGKNLSNIHRFYLNEREFNPDYIIEKYKIKGTLDIGQYPFRIIIPIFYNNEIVTFQTRTIKNDTTRYINCDPDKEIIPIKECIYNIDNCTRNYCVLTEGVFKVWRLGDNSCACLGKNYTQKQLLLLAERFKTIFVFFDPDIYGQDKAKKICSELKSLGLNVYNVENEIAPDDITPREAIDFMKSIEDNL